MRRIIPVLLLALTVGLGGCAFFDRLKTAADIITSASVSPTAVYVASNTFDALEVTATNYLRLKKCTGTNGPICRSPVATAIIIPAVRTGRDARDELQAFLRSHPGALGPQGAYDALAAASDTLKSVFAQYKIGAPQ